LTAEAWRATTAVSDVTVSKTQVARYETVEFTFRMQGQWQNPFDADEVRVDAIFTGADGEQTTMPDFFYQEYRRRVSGGRESSHPVGEPCWKVRFAPSKPGRYSCQLVGDCGYLGPEDQDGGKFMSLMTHANGRAQVRPLCRRVPGSDQHSHGHPVFSLDDCWVLYNSMIGQTHNVYMADVHSLA